MGRALLGGRGERAVVGGDFVGDGGLGLATRSGGGGGGGGGLYRGPEEGRGGQSRRGGLRGLRGLRLGFGVAHDRGPVIGGLRGGDAEREQAGGQSGGQYGGQPGQSPGGSVDALLHTSSSSSPIAAPPPARSSSSPAGASPGMCAGYSWPGILT